MKTENPGFSDPVGAVVPIGPKTRCEAPSKRVSIHKDNFGPDSIKGFPVSFTNKGTWCQRLKTRFLESPAARGGTNIVEYLGIAADEPGRFGQLNERKRAPLVEFGIEEGLCGLYCQYEGIWPQATKRAAGTVLDVPQSGCKPTPAATQEPLGAMGNPAEWDADSR